MASRAGFQKLEMEVSPGTTSGIGIRLLDIGDMTWGVDLAGMKPLKDLNKGDIIDLTRNITYELDGENKGEFVRIWI